jgi:hypothetical protein
MRADALTAGEDLLGLGRRRAPVAPPPSPPGDLEFIGGRSGRPCSTATRSGALAGAPGRACSMFRLERDEF